MEILFSVHDRLLKIYSAKAKDKIGIMAKLLQRYEGREHDLYDLKLVLKILVSVIRLVRIGH